MPSFPGWASDTGKWVPHSWQPIISWVDADDPGGRPAGLTEFLDFLPDRQSHTTAITTAMTRKNFMDFG
jgi:hypothetical protein